MNSNEHILWQRRAALAQSYALHCDELSALAARHPDWPNRDATHVQVRALMKLTAQEHAGLAALEAALRRLAQGRYGQCERCGAAIAATRLHEDPARLDCEACAEETALAIRASH